MSSTSDPASLLSKTVKIHSLASRPELNNRLGFVTTFNTERNRYLVQLHPLSPTSPSVSIRAENLAVASLLDKAHDKFSELRNQAFALYNDPHTRQQIQRLYSTIDRSLPNSPVKIHPEHLLIGSLIIFLLSMRLLGLNKTIMIFSLFSITIMIALQDIVTALSQPQQQRESTASLLKAVARNFPMRWRNVVAQAIGWPTISHRLALALWFLLLLIMGRLLIMKSPKQHKYRQPKVESVTLGREPNNHNRKVMDNLSIQDIYKMGFDDASQGLDYGSSLPMDLDNYMIRLKTAFDPSPADNILYDNDPYIMDNVVPTRRRKAKLGYMTIGAFYSLFKTIKELGFHDGRFDARLLMANLKTMQPWRLGLLGFSLYQVVSALLF